MSDLVKPWPDPARPGVPLNPEEDGWHHVKECPDSSAKIVFWSGHGGNTHYENGDLKHHEGWDGYPLWIAEEWRYLGPVFTPDGTAALIARIAELEAALRQICDGPRDADKSYAELFAEVCWEARAALKGGKKDE